jgi:hypothetical protein
VIKNIHIRNMIGYNCPRPFQLIHMLILKTEEITKAGHDIGTEVTAHNSVYPRQVRLKSTTNVKTRFIYSIVL